MTQSLFYTRGFITAGLDVNAAALAEREPAVTGHSQRLPRLDPLPVPHDKRACRQMSVMAVLTVAVIEGNIVPERPPVERTPLSEIVSVDDSSAHCCHATARGRSEIPRVQAPVPMRKRTVRTLRDNPAFAGGGREPVPVFSGDQEPRGRAEGLIAVTPQRHVFPGWEARRSDGDVISANSAERKRGNVRPFSGRIACDVHNGFVPKTCSFQIQDRCFVVLAPYDYARQARSSAARACEG